MRDTPVPLALQGVSLTLPSAAGPVEILRDVDLAIGPRERVAVSGPSGSGKSSLIAVAAGLERPSAGRVLLFGEDLARLGEDRRARLRRGRVSLVFQAFHLLPNMTAEENVAAPLEIASQPKARAGARAWLERVGLAHRLRHYPHQLSGGERIVVGDQYERGSGLGDQLEHQVGDRLGRFGVEVAGGLVGEQQGRPGRASRR